MSSQVVRYSRQSADGVMLWSCKACLRCLVRLLRDVQTLEQCSYNLKSPFASYTPLGHLDVSHTDCAVFVHHVDFADTSIRWIHSVCHSHPIFHFLLAAACANLLNLCTGTLIMQVAVTICTCDNNLKHEKMNWRACFNAACGAWHQPDDLVSPKGREVSPDILIHVDCCLDASRVI